MGRYISGDIEGKCWFGVQSSDDASFFGGTIQEPTEINYYFDQSDMDKLEEGIEKCKDKLGPQKESLDKFFETHTMYTDKELINCLFINKNQLKSILEWYARLELGEKIHKYLKENDCCYFSVEL